MAEDFEAFIQEQKQKLAQEREVLGDKQPDQTQSKHTPNKAGTHQEGLPLGGYEEHRRNLQEERAREYNSLLAKQSRVPGKGQPSEDQPHVGLPLGGYEDQRRKLQQQRHQEYNTIAKQGENPPQNGFKENVPPKPSTPANGFLGRLGQYEDKRRKLQEERAVEYNRMIAEQKFRSTGVKPPATEVVTVPTQPAPQHTRSSPQVNGNEDLDRDFQEFLEEKRRKAVEKQVQSVERRQAAHTVPHHDQFEASLPGVRDHPSAEVAKMRERNREYNDQIRSVRKRPGGRARWQRPDSQSDEEEDLRSFLNDHRPRKGWATPTYEEILDKKRQEERSYRRFDEPDLYAAPGLRSSFSDGHLNRHLQQESRRFQDLDREYESKKVRFRDESHRPSRSRGYSRGILDDPDWLSPRSGRLDDFDENDELLARLRLKYGPDYIDDVARGRIQTRRPEPDVSPLEMRLAQRNVQDRQPEQAPAHSRSRSRDADPVQGQYQGTLAIGSDSRASADQRRKEAYRQQLLKQMEESRTQRARERAPVQSPTATAIAVPERNGTYEPRVPTTERPAYGGLQDPLRALLDGGPVWSPLEEAYQLYANRNPTDASPLLSQFNAPPGFTSGQQGVPSHSSGPTAPGHDRTKSNEAKDSFPFPSGDDLKQKQRQQQQAYQEELKRQVEEQKLKKQQAKEEQQRYEKKLDEEIRNYDPFGRGGAGAPMRDTHGNIIANRKPGSDPDTQQSTAPPPKADLRQMHQENLQAGLPSSNGLPLSSPPDQSQPAQAGSDEATYARGGHGIFGEPKTNQEKAAQNRYQDELRKQMEEKKRAQEEERRRQKEEEDRLMKKIEEDNRRLQQELEEEKQKERAKAEEAQRQAEELRRQQDERRREEDQRRKADEEKHLEELRRKEDEKRLERQRQAAPSPPLPAHQSKNNSTQSSSRPDKPDDHSAPDLDLRRTDSPPVPSLRSQNQSAGPGGRSSPPVPAQRTQSRQSRAQSADVLNQLAKMRQQLQSERNRVEIDLKKEQKQPEVSDPRLYRKPPASNQGRQSTLDVFEVARNKEPVSVRRDSVNPTSLREFQQLKNTKDSDSRQALRSMFPDSPGSSDALEAQQRALLMRQEEELARLKKRGKGGADLAENDQRPQNLGLTRAGSILSARLLDSDSAFIAVNEGGLADVPEGREDSQRNSSARNRRRASRTQTPQEPASLMGSVASLDPDGITRRNEERLHKLKSLAGDDLSLADPDDILERFMAKQQHHRPPSGRTLQDDSWLRPGSTNYN